MWNIIHSMWHTAVCSIIADYSFFVSQRGSANDGGYLFLTQMIIFKHIKQINLEKNQCT